MSLRLGSLRHGFLVLACATLTMLPAIARAQTFSNTQYIQIQDYGVTTPYPSNIQVAGVGGPVGSISVTLNGLTHTYPADLTVGVRSPSGRLYPLMGICGGGTNMNNAVVTFVPKGLGPAFSPQAGTYAAGQCFQTFSLPGALGEIGELGDVIGSSSVNGTWSLYIYDSAGLDTGYVSQGWSIAFGAVSGVPADSANAISYQGRVDTPEGPLESEVTALFRLFDAETGGNRVAPPVIMRVTPEHGLISVPLSFGLDQPLLSGEPRWLDVTLDGVTLTPRRRLAATPLAFHAMVAASATTATNAGSAVTATNATNAANAANATFATSAATAQSVPWTGITGVPAKVADLRWNPASLGDSATIAGSVGIGAEPAGSSRLLVQQATLGPTQWHVEFTNLAAPSFRGGIRLSDTGFVEVSNSTASQFGFFARLSSSGAWTIASDARLKTDVRPVTGMLDAAMKLRPVYFHWLHNDADEDFGLIAQEVCEIMPRLVSGDEAKETLTVNYSQLSVVAIAAIQELKAQHDAEMAEMRAQIDALAAQNAELLKRLDAIQAER